VRVLCFGRGPLEPRLRAELAERGLTELVTLAGFRADLPELVPGLDVLVHPASREGLGVALLEAASAGVPVVACDVGGVPDVVDHGRTGLLVPADDAAALRAALARLLRDRAERARLGAAARGHVERRFDVASLVDAHLSLYRRVRSERAAGATPTVTP
jgi:glycosyltransferase involved in cell wall biosynthesis